MIAALHSLQLEYEAKDLPGQLAAFGINGSDATSFFMSHPPLEERIAALKNMS